jgi:2-keto-myo-inositol isomerase
MIPCINQATVMKADTLQFIESAGRNGFPQVEFDIDRLEAGIKQDSLATIRAGIEEAGLEVVSLNAIDNYPILSDDDMSSSLARTAKVLDLARSVDCNILILNPANFGSPAEVKLVERRFDEFVEHVSYDNKVVNDLPKTLAALERWGKNVFLVLDVFHMYRKGETMKDLPESYMDRLLAFHVNDAPEMPIARVVDTDRVLPLDGVIGVKNYMIDLKARGYKGPVSVELFNEKYWQMDVDLAIQKSKASIDNLLSF